MFTQDITEQALQRAELKEARAVAEQASKAKSEFLANMSHEIRTPLNGVIGFTDLVLKTDLTETQQHYLGIVNQSANALLGTINDILDFSKIEADKLELDIDKADLYELASQAADIVTFQAQNKGLEMLLNVSSDLPRFIWADAIRLKQVLVNLLGNAVKFTTKGEIELRIHKLQPANGNQALLRFGVRDTGIGIHPEKLHKIFEAFLQEDVSTTKKYGGTGLGLTISNRLLALMNSKLELTSAVGKGSTFYFDIMLKVESGDPVNWDNLDHIKRVLIVDDNSNNRTIVRQMFLLRSIVSDEASNGFEALQKLARGEEYDVILMDYHMPYMDGLETIRKIRESFYASPEKQPVILLHSSSDDEKIIKACAELQINQRLVKPLKFDDLYNALNKLKLNPDKAQQAAQQAQDYGAPFTILVAEDNEVNMLLARTIIRHIAPNATVMEAINGAVAFEMFKHRTPDMVLMDVQMPDMNGYEATRQIRSLPTGKQVPIVALTAANVKGEKERCIEAGMDDYITKPFLEDTLRELFRKYTHYGSPATDDDAHATVADDSPPIKTGHYDPNAIKQLLDVDDDTIKEMLEVALRELLAISGTIEQASIHKDMKKLNALGHKLYGICVTTGLVQLAQLASKLEHTPAYDEKDIPAQVDNILMEILVVTGLICEHHGL